MHTKKLLVGIFSLFLILGTNACNESSNTSKTGTNATGSVRVLLTDAPGDYKSVYVTIDKILVHKADDDNSSDDNTTEDSNATDNDSGWITVAEPHQTYDILKLENNVTVSLGDANISAGTYTQLRLVLHKNDTEHPYSNYVIISDGDDPQALKVPSNTIKTNRNFTIVGDSNNTLTIDFDANKSIKLHKTGNGKLILTPVISVDFIEKTLEPTLENNETGSVQDSVSASSNS